MNYVEFKALTSLVSQNLKNVNALGLGLWSAGSHLICARRSRNYVSLFSNICLLQMVGPRAGEVTPKMVLINRQNSYIDFFITNWKTNPTGIHMHPCKLAVFANKKIRVAIYCSIPITVSAFRSVWREEMRWAWAWRAKLDPDCPRCHISRKDFEELRLTSTHKYSA